MTLNPDTKALSSVVPREGSPPLSVCLLSPVPESREARERLEHTVALISSAPSGFSVAIVLLGDPDRAGGLRVEGSPVTVIPVRDPHGVSAIGPFRNYLQKVRCDLVHLLNFSRIPWACLGAVGLSRIMADPLLNERESAGGMSPLALLVSAFMVEEKLPRQPAGKTRVPLPSRRAVLDLPPSMGQGGEPFGGEANDPARDPQIRGYRGLCHTLVREKAFSEGRRGRTLVRTAVSRLFSRPSPPPGTLRILMYHRVAETTDRDILTVTPFSFAQQMSWLSGEGWTVLPLGSALACLESGSLPPRAVAITFDDGYRDNYDEAYPILRRHGHPATVFPVTGFVLGESEHRRYRGACPPVPYLTVEQIREMKGNGIDFGGHTHTHPLLSSLSVEAATEEISRAKKLLEEWTGEKSTLFAYPNGVYSRDHFRILDGLGYEAAFSVHPGANRAGTLRWILRRTEVSGRDSLGDFIQKMNGGLDLWHGLYQGVRGFYR